MPALILALVMFFAIAATVIALVAAVVTAKRPPAGPTAKRCPGCGRTLSACDQEVDAAVATNAGRMPEPGTPGASWITAACLARRLRANYSPLILSITDELAARGILAKDWAAATGKGAPGGNSSSLPRVRFARLEQIIRDRAARPAVTKDQALSLYYAATDVDPKNAARLEQLAGAAGL